MKNPFSKFGRSAQPLAIGAAKTFYVASSAVQMGELQNTFPNDEEGVVRAHSTISSALSSCVANRGDVVYVLPGYTETLTSALTISVAGVSVIGLGNGTKRPTLTGNGTIDAVNITGDGVLFENFAFAAPETDEQTAAINVAAAGVTVRNVRIIGSKTSKNIVDCITVASGADDLTIDDVRIYNSVVAVNSFISFEAAVARLTMTNVMAFGDVATGGLIDAATVTHLFMENVRIAVVGSSKPAATLDSNPTGIARNCFFSGTVTTLASNGALGNAMRVDNIKVLEETNNSASAAIIPAVDTD